MAVDTLSESLIKLVYWRTSTLVLWEGILKKLLTALFPVQVR